MRLCSNPYFSSSARIFKNNNYCQIVAEFENYFGNLLLERKFTVTHHKTISVCKLIWRRILTRNGPFWKGQNSTNWCHAFSTFGVTIGCFATVFMLLQVNTNLINKLLIKLVLTARA